MKSESPFFGLGDSVTIPILADRGAEGVGLQWSFADLWTCGVWISVSKGVVCGLFT
jgi:hypothetical protein